jgi:Flp pilus assembly CpaE family ATPase
MQRFSAEDLATRQAQMCRLIAVYQNIIRPENWREWVKIIDRFTTREFNLSARNSNDPNKIAQVNTEEDLQLSEDGGYEMIVDGVDVLGFTEYRDSYMRDMYKAVDVNLKMMLWSITENNKFTADGLLKFANVRDLYTRLVHEIANSNSVEDMLSKLALAAKQQKDEEGSDTLSKVLDTL